VPRTLTILGAVAVVVGLLVLLFSAGIQTTPTTVNIPAGEADQLGATTVGPESFTATWSGENYSTTVYLIAGTPTCRGTPSGMLATGSGVNGTITATLNGGHTYSMYGCLNGQGEAITVNWTSTGYTLLGIAGGVFLVIGAMGLVIGAVWKPKLPPPGPGDASGRPG
jgi:hypothetical protein